jgi:hypothetical protein
MKISQSARLVALSSIIFAIEQCRVADIGVGILAKMASIYDEVFASKE